METLTIKQCEAFQKQPSVNPLTGNIIKVGGPTFLKLVEKCDELKRKQVTTISLRHTEEVNPNNLKQRILVTKTNILILYISFSCKCLKISCSMRERKT